MAKFKITQSSKNNEFYFSLKAGNGETILTSEGYKAKSGCTNGIASVKTNAPLDARYDRKDAPTFSFTLKAANGEVIGRSESYSSASARDNGIESVKRNAPDATIEE